MEGKRDFTVPQKRQQQQQQAPQQREARRGLFTGPKPLYGSSEPKVGYCPSHASIGAAPPAHEQGALCIKLAC